MRASRAAWTTVLAVVGGLALVLVLVVVSGVYDVAATEPHTAPVRLALSALQHRSVAVRAGSVEGVPPTDPEAIEHGMEHFDAMCVQCHGAPGVERGEVGQGMTPTPPDLAEEGPEWSDQELFWITRNGIKLAGMPAFGPTHSDEEIWAIVGFVRRLPDLTPEAYATARDALHAPQAEPADGGGTASDGHDHQHEHGNGP